MAKMSVKKPPLIPYYMREVKDMEVEGTEDRKQE
jgi:hypothetical protein